MTRLIVEAAFGYTVTSASPVWTEITRYVDIAAGISITRGAQDELSETQPGTCSLVLNDEDGRFTAGLASGVYYPNVKKNVPLRVRVVTTAKNLVTNPSFETDVSDWSATGSPTPGFARSTVRAQHGTASGLITWGTGGTPAVQTTLYGLDIGQAYTASAYVWVPASNPAVRLGISGGSTGTASATTGAWERITITFTATFTSHTLQVTPATAPTSGQQVWVDAVQAEEGSSAATFDPDGAQIHPRFCGMVNEWPVTWDGLYAKVSITATDVFKWLSRLPALQPMLVHEVLLDGPLAYYPLSEPEESTSAGDLSGAVGPSALTIQQKGTGGTITFGQDGGPDDSLGVPVFAPVDVNNGKYLLATLGQAFRDASSTEWISVECWFSTSTSSNNRCFLQIHSSSQARFLLFYLANSTGYLTVQSRDPDLIDTTTVGATNLADGQPHHLVYDEENQQIWVDGVSLGTFPNIIPTADISNLVVGGSLGASGGQNLWSGTVSHVALYASDALTAADLTTHYTTGTTAHSGEAADDRIARLASYIGLAVTAQGSTFDGIAPQRELGRAALEHMREVERTESGKLLASRSATALVFQSRDLRYNPMPVISLEYADLETDEVEFAVDDQKLVNTVIASRPGGATQRILNADSRDAYGIYEQTLDILKTTDNAVADAGNWLISRYADPPPELREVPVEASTLPLADYRELLDADVSTVLEVTDLPDEAPTATATVTVEGYTESIRENQHRIDFHASRAQTDSVWVLNDTTYSVLGTTTRLAY